MKAKAIITSTVLCFLFTTLLFANEKSPKAKSAQVTYPIDMIIITNESLKSPFQEFAKLKNREGINTFVVTTESLGSNAPEIIREYIHQQKKANLNLQYILLGGDASIIPAYMVHDRLQSNNFDVYPNEWGLKFPTDYYYENVLTEWNDDYENQPFTPHVFVGRIPADTIKEVQNFITKYKNYRYNSNPEYTRTVRLVDNNTSRVLNTSPLKSPLVTMAEKILPPLNVQITRDYELSPPTAETVGNILNEGTYSLLFLQTRGDWANSLACINYKCVYPPQNPPDLTYMNLTTEHDFVVNGLHGNPAASYRFLPDFLTNTEANPYVYFSGINTLSQFYKMSTCDPNKYVPYNCFNMEFMTNNNGAVAIIGSSYTSYLVTATRQLSSFINTLQTSDNKKLAYLNNQSLLNTFNKRNIVTFDYLSSILFGDPSMDVWSQSSCSLDINKTYTGKTMLTVHVSSNLDAVNKATVCLLNPDDSIFLRETTNEFGDAIITSSLDLTSKRLSICAPNYVPYYETKTRKPVRHSRNMQK